MGWLVVNMLSDPQPQPKQELTSIKAKVIQTEIFRKHEQLIRVEFLAPIEFTDTLGKFDRGDTLIVYLYR